MSANVPPIVTGYSTGTTTYPPPRDRWLRALIVGATILVWLSIAGALVGAAATAWLVADLGSSGTTITDRDGATCDRSEATAVPYLLCPESLAP